MDAPAALLSAEPWRLRLAEERSRLKQQYQNSGNALALLRHHSQLIDQLLTELWQSLAIPADLALLAVGGYGRGELYPHSDIDLLILLPEHESRLEGEKLEDLLRILWDIGLEVGHSVRNLPSAWRKPRRTSRSKPTCWKRA